MNHITYIKEASSWEEAFPIGNGRMGAMVFGNTAKERLQLNEDSIWYGGYRDRVNPDAKDSLEEVRKRILDGKIPEAQELMKVALSGTPQSQHPYQTAGDLLIFWEKKEGEITGYRRTLDLDRGMVTVEFDRDGVHQTREYLASYPQQILAVKVTSSVNDISFSMRLERSRFYEYAGKKGGDTIFLKGDCGKEGNSFILASKVQAEGGSVETIGEHLVVKDAREAVIYLSMETSFYCGENMEDTAYSRLHKAAEKGYDEVRDEHIRDYQELFGKMELHLGKTQEADCPELLKSAGEESGEPDVLEKQRKLTELYFQFGRYLLIAGSRPGSQALTLQGIWNEDMKPRWDSKYTININTEMNYWPAEMCNVSSAHLPLFDLLKRMHEKGKKVAHDMYGCRGFVAHHNTDLWGDCAPQDIYIPATYWVMGGAWLCTHIWKHYLYTLDKEFLEEMYPLLRDAVLFFHDFLIEDGGHLITCPSVSPENTYILPNGVKGSVCAGSSMDTQILRDLIDGFLKAADVLGEKGETEQYAKEILKRLAPIRVGKYGQIMEWREDYEEEEPGHRHISQLYALHPSHQITVDKTPELAEAAEKTLERRLYYGGGHTGWSCAWIVNFYVRLGKGEKAWENLKKLWTNSTFPNFMDNHPSVDGPVFQIDGNLGATAGIAEMLVQADEDRIILLPALPKEWPDGSVKGLRLPGNGEISVSWENGALKECEIRFACDSETWVLYRGKSEHFKFEKGKTVKIKM